MPNWDNLDNTKPKINLYRNISAVFLVFTLIIVAAVFFLFYNQAVITVTRQDQDFNLSFNLTLKNDPTAEELAQKDIIKGSLVAYEKEGDGEFSVLSSKTVEDETVGQVQLVNNSNQDQTLVKTTQLQAKSGVIVRTSRTVVVPAGGQVMVAVYPKEPDDFSPIAASSSLAIIKLNPSLQDKIYGLTKQSLTREPREVKVFSASDINRAKSDLEQQLLNQLQKDLGVGPDRIAAKVADYQADQKMGSEIDTFHLRLKLTAKVLEFDQKQLAALLARKAGSLNLNGLDIAAISTSDAAFSIEEENLAGSVVAKVNYVIKAKLADNNQLFEKSNFVGKTPDEAKSWLLDNSGVKEVKIKLSPSWNKKLPGQSSKIKIIIQ